MHSPDLSQDNIAKIRELFSGCVTEGRDEATCRSHGNTGGCSAEVFDAWCTRRVPGKEHIWDDLHYDWIEAACDGAVKSRTNAQGKEELTCEDTWKIDVSSSISNVMVWVSVRRSLSVVASCRAWRRFVAA